MIFRNQLAVAVEIDQLRLRFELCMSAPPGLAWQMRFQPARAQALRGEATTRSLRMPEVTGNKVMGAISPGIGVLILSVLQQSQQVTELTETHRGETAVQLGHACTCLFLVVYKIALAICDNVLVGPLNTVAIRGES